MYLPYDLAITVLEIYPKYTHLKKLHEIHMQVINYSVIYNCKRLKLLKWKTLVDLNRR